MELDYKGYKLVLLNESYLTKEKTDLLQAIEDYSLELRRGLKVVFFNYDDDKKETGVSFFFKKEYPVKILER